MDLVIKERKKLFYYDDRFHDISFSFPDTDRLLRANKTILTLVSPVFEKMFFGDLAEKQDPVPILDIDIETFRKFLRFIYTEEFSVSSLEEAQQIFYVAHKYEVISTEAACERYIISNINNFDLTELIMFAEMFSLKELERLCRLLKDHSPNRNVPCHWEKYKKGDPIPSNMVFADFDKDGFPLGIGRFQVERDLVPGTFYVKDGYVSVSYGCLSHKQSDEFEVLCDGDVDWVETRDGQVPSHTVVGGRAEHWENLHIGKVKHNGVTVVGKVHPRHSCLYIPWGDAEYKVSTNYEHLIDRKQPREPERNADFRDYEDYAEYYSGTDEEGSDGEEEPQILEPIALP